MTWATVANFLHEHREGIALFAMAMAVSMHEKLPWPFVKIEALEWSYEWVRKGILTFISMRGPAHSEATVQTQSRAVDNKGDAVEFKKTATVSSSQPDPAPEPIPEHPPKP